MDFVRLFPSIPVPTAMPEPSSYLKVKAGVGDQWPIEALAHSIHQAVQSLWQRALCPLNLCILDDPLRQPFQVHMNLEECGRSLSRSSNL
jgi:hypothetical protein